MGFTVICLLVFSSTACISSQRFVVVVELVVDVTVLPTDGVVAVDEEVCGVVPAEVEPVGIVADEVRTVEPIILHSLYRIVVEA